MSTELFLIFDTTGADKAVSVVERKIGQVKERLRAIINTFPYRLTEQLHTLMAKMKRSNRVHY